MGFGVRAAQRGTNCPILITSKAVSNMLSLDIGAAMKVLLCGRSRGRKRLDKISPEPLARPMVETVVNLCLRPMFVRTITPTAPRFLLMDHLIDHGTTVNTVRAALSLWQAQFDHRPLLLRQPIANSTAKPASCGVEVLTLTC